MPIKGYYIQFDDETLDEAKDSQTAPFETIEDAESEARAISKYDGEPFKIFDWSTDTEVV